MSAQPNTKKKKKEKTNQLKSTDYEALSALLDFNSDRAVAHASFLVACVFGLFTLLSLIKEASLILRLVYSITYWIVWFGGYYSLMGFNRYATDAEDIRRFIEQNKSTLIGKFGRKDKKTRGAHYRAPYSWINERWRIRKLKLMLICYFIVGMLPWFFTVKILQWFFTLL